ncbi:oxidoreductase [Flavobacterium rivuli WB 3.3-2 = DSM 21788]|uniref:Oxidoreductase n=1 Tax=Flavobacterium rivuli WB 3.3-2 = DSM 21788 TaxID=1121895 RepID=A0A0A2M6Z4_9FLAO|nr:SDR family NAD(P)-dependent oxidoreductase [Flavobacterium rivuli]KGO87406.1 oxidoreductase [Flavobacterium rivuli WB 3.3-2 = DSM 21788]
MDNSQKFALVTGATSGIGYELARLFAKDGINLVLVARNQENLNQTADELRLINSIQVHTIAADLFEPNAAKEVYDRVKETGVEIDYLVNNAGQGEWGRFFRTELDRDIDIVQLNIVALISLTKYFLKEMVSRNSGRILQLASSFAKTPAPYAAVYAASKAFVLSFSEALVNELEETDVTVTALLPNATDTDWFHKAKAENTVTYKETPLYDPAEVAGAGYKALMNGDAKAEPGFMNKLQNAMGALMPDSTTAGMAEKQMESSMKEDGRTATSHAASARERETIGSINGDSKTYKVTI